MEPNQELIALWRNRTVLAVGIGVPLAMAPALLISSVPQLVVWTVFGLAMLVIGYGYYGISRLHQLRRGAKSLCIPSGDELSQANRNKANRWALLATLMTAAIIIVAADFLEINARTAMLIIISVMTASFSASWLWLERGGASAEE